MLFNQNNPNLLNDLNIIMRCIKKRQQLHLTLLDYIKKLLNVKQIDQFAFFLDQQLRTHKNFFEQTTNRHHKIKQQEKKTQQIYQTNRIFQQSQLKLINRLCLRIMEICQASYQKLKQYFEFYDECYKQFYDSLTNILQNDNINLIQLFNIMLNYSYNKFEEDLKQLEKMIKMIQNGQRENLSRLYHQRLQKKRQKILQLKRKQLQLIKEEEQKVKIQKQKFTEKISKMKQEAKSLQKVRKKKSKFVDKICSTIYGVLEPSKHQMMEDLNYTKQDDQFKRLYTEIFQKNRIIYLQILEFSAKSDDFKEKVKKFKEMMLLQQVPRIFQRKNHSKLNIKKHHQYDLSMIQQNLAPNKNQMNFEETQIPSSVKIEGEFNSEQQLVQSIPRFSRKSLQMKIESNYSLRKPSKSYLPQIPFQSQGQKKQRYDSVIINKAKRFSQLKNIEINQTPLIFKPQLKIMPISNIQINMDNKFESRFQEARKKESAPKSFQYTFYMKKKGPSKFQEARNNFLL